MSGLETAAGIPAFGARGLWGVGAPWSSRDVMSRAVACSTLNTAQACGVPFAFPIPCISEDYKNPRSCFDQHVDVLEHLELTQSSKKLIFAKKLLK